MAKFTRTAYTSGSLRDIADRIAHQSGLAQAGTMDAVYDGVHSRKTAAHGKRVRITILVEPVATPPKRPRGPKRAKPVQQALPLEVPATVPSFMRNLATGVQSTLDTLTAAVRHVDPESTRMPMYGADGGAT